MRNANNKGKLTECVFILYSAGEMYGASVGVVAILQFPTKSSYLLSSLHLPHCHNSWLLSNASI